MNKTKKTRLNTQMPILLFFLTVFFFLGSGIALADVNPSSITGSPGDTVTLVVSVDTAVTDMSDWGMDIYFDTDVLEFSSVDTTDTISSVLTASGTSRSFGARIGAYSTGQSATADAGTLIKVLLNVKSTAYKNSAIQLTNFADYIAGASTTDSTFTITGVTTTVVVTPSATTDLVAGQAVTLTAEVLVNGSHLDLTDAGDVSFAKSGNGTFGSTSLTGEGKVQVSYTSHTTVESATITATENVTGNSNTGTATVTSIAGSPDADTSTVAADPTSDITVSSDGSIYSTVTITLKDANNNPVSG